MSISVTNLALNGAGIALDATALGRFTREVSIYNQDSYVKTELELKGASFVDKLLTKPTQIFGTGTPIFHSSVLNMAVKNDSRICDHPLEDGSVISDYKVRMPIEINMQLVMPHYLGSRVIDEMEKYFLKSTKVVIQCATGVYTNLILTALPTNLTPQNVDAPIFNLSFREVIIVSNDQNDPLKSLLDEDESTEETAPTTQSFLGGLSDLFA